MNKKIYLKPYCAIVPIRVQGHLLTGSLEIDGKKTVQGTDGGWAREQVEYPRPGSVWDE